MAPTLHASGRRHCVRQSAPSGEYSAGYHEWALDRAHNAVASGRAIRVLSVVDAYMLEYLAPEVDNKFALACPFSAR